MKNTFTLFASFFFFIVFIMHLKVTDAQIKAVEADSVEARQQMQDQRERLNILKSNYGTFSVGQLKVGHWGVPANLDAKVIQVIDDNQMIVGIEDDRTGSGAYKTWVIIKCATKDIVDGKFWRSEDWEEIVGTKAMKVTGTKQYATAIGGTNTVYVVEPMSNRELSKLLEYRIWTTRNGNLLAKFVKLEKGKVQLKRPESDELVTVSPYSLSRHDRSWLRDEVKKRSTEEKNENANSEKERSVADSNNKPKLNPITPSIPLPISWINETYKVTVRRLGD